jgi:hypothetical protein
MTRLESSLRHGEEKQQEMAKLRAELDRLNAVAAPLHRQVDRAQYVLNLINAFAHQRYGEDATVMQEGAHPRIAAAYGQQVVRAVKAA